MLALDSCSGKRSRSGLHFSAVWLHRLLGSCSNFSVACECRQPKLGVPHTVMYVLLCPQVFMLSSDRLLDEATLQEILVSGHSRIPLHEPGDRWEPGPFN